MSVSTLAQPTVPSAPLMERRFISIRVLSSTPSAIFIDRRGNKYVGSRAYNSAAKDLSVN
jgi:hypothetical protein